MAFSLHLHNPLEKLNIHEQTGNECILQLEIRSENKNTMSNKCASTTRKTFTIS